MTQKHSPDHHLFPKATYCVQNWPAYNRALVSRGQISLWIDDDVLRGLRARGGRGLLYSYMAIRGGLCLRSVFWLALRQTLGGLESLKALMGLTIPVPHYSTLSRPGCGAGNPCSAIPRIWSGEPCHCFHGAEGFWPRRVAYAAP